MSDRDPTSLYRFDPQWGSAPAVFSTIRCWWWRSRVGWTPAWGRRRRSPSCWPPPRSSRWLSFDDRTPDRPAGPPADRPARGRGHHPAHLAHHPDGRGQGPGRSRHRVPHRTRARLPMAELRRGRGRTGAGPRGPDRGRPRRLSRTDPAHPTRAAGVHGASPVPPSSPTGSAPSAGPSRCRPECRRHWRSRSGTPACRSSACGPGSPTTCRPCPIPRRAPPWSKGCARCRARCSIRPSLRSAGDTSRRQVDELIAANPEHLDMVRRLEVGARLRGARLDGTRQRAERRRDRRRAGAVPQGRRALTGRAAGADDPSPVLRLRVRWPAYSERTSNAATITTTTTTSSSHGLERRARRHPGPRWPAAPGR